MGTKWAYRTFLIMIFTALATVLLWFIHSVRAKEQSLWGIQTDSKTQQRLELSFWNTWNRNEDWEKVLYERIQAFEKDHPDVLINVQSIPHDEYKIKIKAAAAGKELPDMLVVWPGAELRPLVMGNALLPLGDEITDRYRNVLIPAENLADYAVGGKQYAIPTVVSYTSIIYYDKDLLHSLGYSAFPDTYERLKELLLKVKAKGILPISLGNKGKWVLQSCYLSTIGSRFTGDSFLPLVLQGKRKFTDNDFVSALRVIEELNGLGMFNENKNSMDDLQQLDMFILGKSFMTVSGSWALNSLIEKYPKGKQFGIAVFPRFPSQKEGPLTVSGVTGQGIALNANLPAEKRDAALAFIETMSSEITYKKLLYAQTPVPARISPPMFTDPPFRELLQATSNGLSPVYDATLPTELIELLNQELQDMTKNPQITAEKVAAKLQNKMETIRQPRQQEHLNQRTEQP